MTRRFRKLSFFSPKHLQSATEYKHYKDLELNQDGRFW